MNIFYLSSSWCRLRYTFQSVIGAYLGLLFSSLFRNSSLGPSSTFTSDFFSSSSFLFFSSSCFYFSALCWMATAFYLATSSLARYRFSSSFFCLSSSAFYCCILLSLICSRYCSFLLLITRLLASRLGADVLTTEEGALLRFDWYAPGDPIAWENLSS